MSYTSRLELTNISNGIEPKWQQEFSRGLDNNGYVIEMNEGNLSRKSSATSNNNDGKQVRSSKRVTYSWNSINAWIGSGELHTNGVQERTLCCRKKPETKVILNNVSGIIRAGELVAVIGASGAGKSTLMDVLTFRNARALKVSGTRAINGTIIESNTITSISAYVQQMDLFIGVLTVREHLIFQALVRMDAHVPHQERMNRVEEVIKEFGLSKCADSRIGTKWFKGISGGEMRRLSIATEVLTDPLFMVCDEPISGLDSNSAQTVLTILKDLANQGKTVLVSIHQPSSQLFALFDRVLVMVEGRIAYMGPTMECLEFFGQQGYSCPNHYNPADFLIEVLAVPDVESQKKVHRICDAFEESSASKEMKMNIRNRTISGDESMARESSRYKASWITQFGAVFKRSWLSYIRDPMVLKMRFVQTIILALFVGVIYFQEDIRHVDGIQNVSGAIFMCLCSLTYQNVFGVLDVFCSELPVFLREHFNGMYRTDVYFISKILVEIPFYIILPTVFTAIAYYMVGFDPNVYSFLKTAGILILVTYICSVMGYMLSCVAGAVTVALLLAPVAVFPFFLFGGFLVRPGSGVAFLRWLQHISWFFYGYETMAIIQLENMDYIECGSNNSTCPANGLVVLENLHFDKDNFERDIFGLIGIGIGVSVLAYLTLLSKTFRR